MTAKLSSTQLHEKIQTQFLNIIRQYRIKSGYPKESPTDQQLLNLVHPNIYPPYDEIKYSIELSAGEVKELLTVLEEYPRLKSERDYLWDWQTYIFKIRNKALEILKNSRLPYAKRLSMVCHEFGLIGGKKRSKYNAQAIRFEYEQLTKGYYCPDLQKHIVSINPEEAIEFLTNKHKFASLNACHHYLNKLNIKGLPNTWPTDGNYK